MEMLEVCQNIISIDSSSYLGVDEICEYYKKLADQLNLPSKFLSSDAGVGGILIGDLESADLIFHSHLDTKDPGPYSLWTKTNSNPFSASFFEESIYGLGVADAKLSLYLQMLALSTLRKKSMHPKVCLLAVIENDLCRDNGFQALNLNLIKPKLALVSKPTNFYIENGLCGRFSGRFVLPFNEQELGLRNSFHSEESMATQTKIFRGEGGHAASSFLNKTENAIDKLSDYLRKMPENILILSIESGDKLDSVPAEALIELNLSEWVEDSVVSKFIALMNQLNFLQQSYSQKYEDNKIGLPLLSVSVVETTKEAVELHVNFYFNEEYSSLDIDKDIKKILELTSLKACKFKPLERLSVQNYAVPLDLMAKVQSAMEAQGLEFKKRSSLFESDARTYHRHGIPCFKFGPGKAVGNISEPNESVRIADLRTSVEVYKNIMEQFL